MPGDVGQLLQQAQRLLTEYEQLTSQGRYREAGERLEQLKQTLAELNRRRGG
jgi:septation ring formation regulator EzrA